MALQPLRFSSRIQAPTGATPFQPVRFRSARGLTSAISTLPTTQVQQPQQMQAPQFRNPFPTAGAVSLTNAVLNTGLRIQDERLTLEAQEAYLQYRNEVRRLQYHPETGYFAKEGKDAVVGFDGYKEEVETLSNQYINNVSPAVKRKLLPMIYQERDQALTLGAKYVVNENNTRKKNVAALMEADFMNKVGERSGNGKDVIDFIESSAAQIGGSETPLEDKRYADQIRIVNFRNKAYAAALQAHLDNPRNSAADAMALYETYKQRGLLPQTLHKMRTGLRNKINQEYTDRTRVQKDEDDLKKRIGRNKLIDYYDVLVSGDRLNTTELDKMVRQRYLTPSQAITIRNRFKARNDLGKESEYDPVAFAHISNSIDDPTKSYEEIQDEIISNTDLTTEDQRYFLKELRSTYEAENKETYRQLKKDLQAIILEQELPVGEAFVRKKLYGSGPSQEQLRAYNEAERDGRARLKKGESLDSIVADYEKRFKRQTDRTTEEYSKIPARLPNNMRKPGTMEAYERMRERLQQKARDGDWNDSDEETLKMWESVIRPHWENLRAQSIRQR